MDLMSALRALVRLFVLMTSPRDSMISRFISRSASSASCMFGACLKGGGMRARDAPRDAPDESGLNADGPPGQEKPHFKAKDPSCRPPHPRATPSGSHADDRHP